MVTILLKSWKRFPELQYFWCNVFLQAWTILNRFISLQFYIEPLFFFLESCEIFQDYSNLWLLIQYMANCFFVFVYKELVQFYLLVRYKNLVQIYRCSVRRVRDTVPKHLFNSHCFLPDVDFASVFLCESIQQFRKFHLITSLMPLEKSSTIKWIGITEQLRTFLPFLSHLYSLNSNIYYA